MAQAPLGALRVFEAAARHGSFSRAADELCVTQSAVSHQVRSLEAWLGASLFERQGNRATLLPHGAELAVALGRSFDRLGERVPDGEAWAVAAAEVVDGSDEVEEPGAALVERL